MGATARITEPWELDDIDCTESYRSVEETVRDDAGNPVLIDAEDETGATVKVPKKVLRYEKRKHYVVKMQRKLVSVTSYSEDTGKLQTAFTWLTGPDTNLNYASSGKKWKCTRDALNKSQIETGAYVNEQTWEFYSAWEKVDKDEFIGA